MTTLDEAWDNAARAMQTVSPSSTQRVFETIMGQYNIWTISARQLANLIVSAQIAAEAAANFFGHGDAPLADVEVKYYAYLFLRNELGIPMGDL